MERIALLASTICYLFVFGHTLYALGAGRFQPGRFNLLAVALGAASQGWYLSMRGAVEHSCPIGSLSETLVFLSWSIALIYLVIGPAYRLSLMGAFTAPLLLLLQIIALLLPGDVGQASVRPGPWVESHAALSLVAFGAFGLACIAGLMFLVQEAQLKSRRPAAIFHHLPPISALAEAVRRLLWAGFLLLTLSFAAGWLAHIPIAGVKFWFSLLIWVLYAGLILGARTGLLSGRRKALGAALTFLLVLLLLPVIQHFSAR
jgi:ABC-type uncharacterized transport system permease subunit